MAFRHFAFALGIISCFCVVVACTNPLPIPMRVHAEWAAQRWPNTDTTALHHGRTLYIRKCSGCHNLYTPLSYSEQEWRKEIAAMQKKAKITDEECETIFRYLVTAAAVPPEQAQLQTAH